MATEKKKEAFMHILHQTLWIHFRQINFFQAHRAENFARRCRLFLLIKRKLRELMLQTVTFLPCSFYKLKLKLLQQQKQYMCKY